MRRDLHALLGGVLLELLLVSCTTRPGLVAKASDGSASGLGGSPGPVAVDGGCLDPTGACGVGSPGCSSLENDAMNCGACGHACLPGIACVAGRCQQRRCEGPVSFQKLAAYPPSPTADTFLPGDYLGADMNRDGRLDLLEYDGAGAIGIWLGREDGTFVLSSSYATTGTGHTWNLPGFAAVGDFTEDGLADVVVMKADLREVQVLPGLPGGGLTAAAGKPIARLSIGDVDADRHLDVAFVPAPDGAVASNVVVLRGSGRGTFTKVKDYAFPDDQIAAAALADWDGNATLDLLVQGMNGLHILNGNGDGSFADDQQCPIGALLAPWFTDLNQDGQLDIVWHPLGNQRLATVLGQGGCSFSPFTSYSIPFDLSLSWISLPDFVVGDVTGDGLADVLTGNSGAAAHFLAGQADGTFAASATVPVDSLGSPTLLFADVNSDGRADVVAAGPHGIEVYANTCDP